MTEKISPIVNADAYPSDARLKDVLCSDDIEKLDAIEEPGEVSLPLVKIETSLDQTPDTTIHPSVRAE